MKRHALLTKQIEESLPKLYSQEKLGDAAIARVKYFTPRRGWTWYGVEYDPDERLFFGKVVGHETEMGYFSLDELEEMAQKGLVERDAYFTPKALQDCR